MPATRTAPSAGPTASEVGPSRKVAEFGWQPHTARGTIDGALKKKLGFIITS
ncbi:MAG TPA: DUF3489 domain-containing protein, partial [Rhodospirillales bacterium]|nr:DUF3489 domain-containing protein [Rhodospirillales bacterium]